MTDHMPSKRHKKDPTTTGRIADKPLKQLEKDLTIYERVYQLSTKEFVKLYTAGQWKGKLVPDVAHNWMSLYRKIQEKKSSG